MAQEGTMVPEFTINGTFVEIHDDGTGKWLAQTQAFEARMTIDRNDLRLAGIRATKYKAMGGSGTGSLRLFKVTDDFLNTIATFWNDNRSSIASTNLRVKIDDPEQIGPMEYLLKSVKFWEAPIMASVNELMEETIPFTFEGFEFLSRTIGVNLTDVGARASA